MIDLFISELPKLPNQLLGAKWFIRASHANKWKTLVGKALIEFLPIKEFAFAQIRFERHSPRPCDFDGLVGSFKPVLDALVYHSVLAGDSMGQIQAEYAWEKKPGKLKGIKVKVEGKYE